MSFPFAAQGWGRLSPSLCQLNWAENLLCVYVSGYFFRLFACGFGGVCSALLCSLPVELSVIPVSQLDTVAVIFLVQCCFPVDSLSLFASYASICGVETDG
eukprot:RCo006899